MFTGTSPHDITPRKLIAGMSRSKHVWALELKIALGHRLASYKMTLCDQFLHAKARGNCIVRRTQHGSRANRDKIDETETRGYICSTRTVTLIHTLRNSFSSVNSACTIVHSNHSGQWHASPGTKETTRACTLVFGKSSVSISISIIIIIKELTFSWFGPS
jgi:hypothetical protein